MKLLLYSDQALEDLFAIKAFIAEESGSEKTARDFVRSLVNRCKWIADFPGSPGRVRTELSDGIYSFVHQNYVIFFTYESGARDFVKIITIVEGHRDLSSVVSNLFEKS